MDFKEYILSLPNANRLAILDGISKHGDPNEILKELNSGGPGKGKVTIYEDEKNGSFF